MANTMHRNHQSYKKVSATLAQLMKVILLDMFKGEHDPTLVGISLIGDDGRRGVRLRARLGLCLMDGGAHQQLWSATLDAGHKMCM